MPELAVKELLEAGCHFGHQTFRWNPKMKPYIFTAKNGVHIIDLDKTVEQAKAAFKFIADQVALGNPVLFVGTKRQAADVISEQAIRVKMHYVNQRWLGGMLTNFKTIKQSIDRLHELCKRRDAGDFAKLGKKEALGLEREIVKLDRSLGGIKDLTKTPGVVILVDPKTEKIAHKEANKLGIPVVAITDTNCDPDNIDYLIPANDDAIRSISLLLNYFADACEEGSGRRTMVIRDELAKAETDKAKAEADRTSSARVRERKVEGKARAYTGDAPASARRGKPGRGPKTAFKAKEEHKPEAADKKEKKKDGAVSKKAGSVTL